MSHATQYLELMEFNEAHPTKADQIDMTELFGEKGKLCNVTLSHT